MDKVRLIINSVMVLGLLGGCVYGAAVLLRGGRGRYCLYIWLSVISMTLGRLFILVYDIAGGDTDGFSLGSLGIISAFFFIGGANRELQQQIPLQLSPAKEKIGRICSVLVMLPLVCVCVFGGLSIGHMLPSLLLLVTTGYGFWSSLRIVLAGSNGGDVYPYLVRFCAIVCTVLICAVLAEALWLVDDEGITAAAGMILGLLDGVCFAVMLPVLDGGLRRWKM